MLFMENLDMPCMTILYANGDNINYSPDENLSLDCFDSGIWTTLGVLDRLTANYGDESPPI